MRHCRKDGADACVWYTTSAELPAAWDAILPEGHYLRRASLAAHEGSKVPNVKVLYVVVSSDSEVVLQAAFQILSVRKNHINKASIKQWQQRLWTAFTLVAHPKLLVGGQLFRHDAETVYWRQRLTVFEAYNHYRKAIEIAARMAKAQAILVKDCPGELATLFQNHAPEYLMLRNDISMEMEREDGWMDMQHYEKSLKHKYAQRYRNVRKRMDGIVIRELTTEEVVQQAAAIYGLYLGVTENQAVRLGILSEEFLPKLKAFYGDELKVWGFYEREKMIAFASGFVLDDSFDMFYIGFDYSRNAELQLYFNILFFSIEQAIALGKRHLILGRTALEAKARVGCKPRYLYSFLYIRNMGVRRMVGALQNRFSEGAEWEERHPFKG